MPTLLLETIITAPLQCCFDLSRSIDLHIESTKDTQEKAIAGVTSGLIQLGETVTWRAKHLGFYHTLTSKITAFDSPHSFTDEMVSGPFQSFRHVHQFTEVDGITIMKDEFTFVSPFGILGKIADRLFLKSYLYKFLKQRNAVIKHFAESERSI